MSWLTCWLILLSVLFFFVTACQPSAEEKNRLGGLTAEELKQLPKDLKPDELRTSDSKTLVGQAVKWTECKDPDATSSFDKNQLLTKSTTYFSGGSKTDTCYTWYKGTPQEKTRLIEGICRETGSSSRFNYWYADCNTLGSDYLCQDGACQTKMLPAASNLALLAGDGKSEHLDLVMVTEGYTDEEIALLEKDVNLFFFGNPAAEFSYQKKGFLEIKPLDKNQQKINVYFIKESFVKEKFKEKPSPADGESAYVGGLFSFVKSKLASFTAYDDPPKSVAAKAAKDIIFVLRKGPSSLAWTIYVKDAITGIIVFPGVTPGSGSSSLGGIYLPLAAHEFGHAFADLTEEYFWSDSSFPEEKLYDAGVSQGTDFGSSNCDLHKKPCEMWCAAVDAEKYAQYLNAVSLMKNCLSILKQQDEVKWTEFCPQLKLEQKFGEKKAAEFCSSLSWFATSQYQLGVCVFTTTNPLKYVDLGQQCQENYGCYFGCGAGINAFRSAPYSIMGCGDPDDCDDFYLIGEDKDILLAYSPPAQEKIKEVFAEY